jgi:aspartyl-tRNA(Asn)/glutamyl-tRNA(Gln) amidotransferase subunit B
VLAYFDNVVKRTENPKQACNWITQEILRHLNDTESEISDFPVSPEQLSDLLIAVSSKKLDQSRGKDVLATMIADASDMESAKKKLGIVEVDSGEIDALCQQLIDNNSAAVEDIRNGNAKAIGSLIGQARKINSNVNPNDVRQTLLKLLGQ